MSGNYKDRYLSDLGDVLKLPKYQGQSEAHNKSVTDRLNSSTVLAGDLANHVKEVDYIVTGMSIDEFVDKYSGTPLSIEHLTALFSIVCPDSISEPTRTNPYNFIFFLAKMLFEIGPGSRKVLKDVGKDKVWQMRFILNENEMEESKRIVDPPILARYNIDKDVLGLPAYTVVVATHKKAPPKNDMPHITKDGLLTLTMKQAGLIACVLLEKVVKSIEGDDQKIILTPLAGAIFSRDDIVEMATLMNMSVADMTNLINSSCQSGGHYLDNSNAGCAIAAALRATQRMPKPKEREALVIKVLSQYMAKDKAFANDEFLMFCKFATGGVPEGLSFDNLLKMAEQTKTKEFTFSEKMRANKILGEEKMKTKKRRDPVNEKRTGAAHKGSLPPLQDVAGSEFEDDKVSDDFLGEQ
ncbi:nucleoprotein [Nome phantom orthophasmavirus]|uniref:Nucleoprotein n=66 Tax=Nome phantom orthophasmavirus TaxID=1980540 RepID=A0A059XN77_9VIRU|nr:nucleoprotein [Nome phantom orthophasmavirus]AIA24564.1 nucleoprotein [Nome phantom orthophasmavirus]